MDLTVCKLQCNKSYSAKCPSMLLFNVHEFPLVAVRLFVQMVKFKKVELVLEIC